MTKHVAIAAGLGGLRAAEQLRAAGTPAHHRHRCRAAHALQPAAAVQGATRARSRRRGSHAGNGCGRPRRAAPADRVPAARVGRGRDLPARRARHKGRLRPRASLPWPTATRCASTAWWSPPACARAGSTSQVPRARAAGGTCCARSTTAPACAPGCAPRLPVPTPPRRRSGAFSGRPQSWWSAPASSAARSPAPRFPWAATSRSWSRPARRCSASSASGLPGRCSGRTSARASRSSSGRRSSPTRATTASPASSSPTVRTRAAPGYPAGPPPAGPRWPAPCCPPTWWWRRSVHCRTPSGSQAAAST